MQDIDYGQLNTTIRVKENDLLKKSHYERMLSASTFDEAVSVLNDTKYRDYVDEVKVSHDYDKMVMDELLKNYQQMIDQTPNPQLAELYTLQYAYHNMKVFFKEKFTDKDLSSIYIPIGFFPIYELRKAVHDNASGVLPQPYVTAIQDVNRDFEEFGQVQSVDILLDRHYLQHYRWLAEEIGDLDIINLVKTRIDFDNMTILVRALRQGKTPNYINTLMSDAGSFDRLDLTSLSNRDVTTVVSSLADSRYGDIIDRVMDQSSELSTSQLDYELDNAYMKLMKTAKFKVFGPLPVIAYLYALETEVKNIRLILSVKLNGGDIERVRERVRESYAV